jgi:hypothetical protein
VAADHTPYEDESPFQPQGTDVGASKISSTTLSGPELGNYISES